MSKTFEISLQIAVMAIVEVEAESFEDAAVKGRALVTDHRTSLKTLRTVLRADGAIGDTESYMTGVNESAAGCMYK